MSIFESIELTRITFLIGIVLALLFRKRFGFNAGGIVAPGFLAITLSSSLWLFLVTFGMSFVVYYLYMATFDKKALRGRYSVLIKMVYSILLMAISTWFLGLFFDVSGELIGYVAPGLIAASYRKYEVKNVAIGTLLVTAATYLLGLLLGIILPDQYLTYIKTQSESLGLTPFELEHRLIHFVFALIVGIATYHFSKARIGGLIILPMIGALLLDPLNFIIFAALVVVILMIVKFVQSFSHLIGLERFAFATVISVILVWIVELSLLSLNVGFSPLLLSALYLPVAVGVWVNDLSIQGVKKSIIPFSIAAVLAVSFELILRLF